MKTSLSFLPQTKQEELTQIPNLLQTICNDIEMVILYGSYARNEYKEKKDLEPNRWSGHVSDYDILVVTGEQKTALDRKLKGEMENLCLEQQFSANARIVLFDLQEMNILLAEGQYFYSDIKKEGIVLFNENGYELADERELTDTEKARIAQDHFEHWYERAVSFYRGHSDACKWDDYKKASFELHQATEACYKCILLVFTNYSPDEHHLSLLETWAGEEVPEVLDLFPKESNEEYKRFNLLDKAYIGARYIREFVVEEEDIIYLAPLVKKLLTATKEKCEKKIAELLGE